MSCIEMDVDMSVGGLIEFMLIFMLAIVLCFFSVRFGLDSWSGMNRSGPGFYVMCILYWCNLNIMR